MAMSSDLEKLRRPKVTVVGDVIFISDPLIVYRIILMLLCLLIATKIYFEGLDANFWPFLGFCVLTLVFLYDSLSLNRVKVDLKRKVIFRTTLNPMANLLDRILQHPSVIPFDKITKFGVDYPLLTGRNVPRWYVFVEYDDLYKLKLGIFKNGKDAESIADFLRYKIKSVR